MRYILPAGFGFSFFFFKQYNRTSWLRDLHKINLIYVGEQYADSIRYPMYDESKQYKVGDMVTHYKVKVKEFKPFTVIDEDDIDKYQPFEVLINTEQRGTLVVTAEEDDKGKNEYKYINVFKCIKRYTYWKFYICSMLRPKY